MTTLQSTSTGLARNGAPSRLPASQERERTPWLLAFLCLLIPILPNYSVPPGPLKSNGSPAKIIAIILFGLTVMGFFLIRRAPGTRPGFRPGVALTLVYFLMTLAVYGVGVSHRDSADLEASKTRVLLVLLAHVGVALYVLARVETVRQRSIVLGCLAVGLTFNCVVGLLQSFTHIDLHLLLEPPGFVVNTSEGIPDLTERFGAHRVFGTSAHPIEFSVLAAVTAPVTIHFAGYAATRQRRLFAALAACVALLAMPAGVSRSGVIALAAALLVYMWAFTLRQLCSAVVGGAVALFAAFAVSPHILQALWQTILSSGEDDSVLARVADYTKVSHTFREHPVFGLGLGGSLPNEYGFLDNEWLQALVQGGIVGLAAMLVLASAGIFGLAAALRRATTPLERNQAYAIGAMLIGLLASSFTFDLMSFQQASLLFFILLGLLWSNFRMNLPVAVAQPSPSTPKSVSRSAALVSLPHL